MGLEILRRKEKPAKLTRMLRSKNAAREPWSAGRLMTAFPAPSEERGVTDDGRIALSVLI